VADAAQGAHIDPILVCLGLGLGGHGTLDHRGPDEPDQLADHRGLRDRVSLAVPDEIPIASLRAPRVAQAEGGLPLAPASQGSTEAGAMAIVHAASTKTQRAFVLPALISAPRRSRSPEEYSLGLAPSRPRAHGNAGSVGSSGSPRAGS
jgi:hypothetical protein